MISGIDVSKIFHLHDFKNLAFYPFAYIECRRKLCSNPLAKLVVLPSPGDQAMGYVEPCRYELEINDLRSQLNLPPRGQWSTYFISKKNNLPNKVTHLSHTTRQHEDLLCFQVP